MLGGADFEGVTLGVAGPRGLSMFSAVGGVGGFVGVTLAGMARSGSVFVW